MGEESFSDEYDTSGDQKIQLPEGARQVTKMREVGPLCPWGLESLGPA